MHATSKKASGTLGTSSDRQHQARQGRRHSISEDAGNGGKTLLQQVMPAIQEEVPLYRKSDLCIPRNEIVGPRSQFLHSCISERFIYSQDRSAYVAAAK
jgi:hypothetical protein